MVAAESQAAADFAVTRITVEYDELPVAASLEGALARDAPLIHEEAARPGSAHGLGRLPDAEGNICYSYSFRRGDVDRAFAEAAVVVEGEYTFPAVYQYSMETHTTIAHWHGGELTLWSSCQHPFLVRQEIAALFGLPLDLRPYRWQAVQVQAHCVYTNTGPAAPTARSAPPTCSGSGSRNWTRWPAGWTWTGWRSVGMLLNDTLLSYRIPAFRDIPPAMHCSIVENGDGPGPFGAKGCGEGALAAIPAAVVNALADAGVPMNTLPLTPERVWRRIQDLRIS